MDQSTYNHARDELKHALADLRAFLRNTPNPSNALIAHALLTVIHELRVILYELARRPLD
jgi:hypothetical protein